MTPNKMFRRLIFEDSAALFTITAFITAVSIFVMVGWRALRMKRPQIERFANLPFATATPESVGLPLVGRPRHGDKRRSYTIETPAARHDPAA